ncbi:ABC transporter ATP-binding protein [Bacillota bacterium Meth-B3]|nr:ABC transporter ATP-binding protein [Christensenellaceae bacterium]MEA5067526.1 ABC transporter ATP-binding protein [Christensenellaceae bacterium]
MSYIEIKNVVKRFGEVTVLKNISLTVNQGEMVTLLGPSGCGKSTLLRAVAGLNDINEGRVFIDGKDVTDIDARRRQVGMVFQSYALFPNMNAEQNIAFGLTIEKRPKDEIKRRVAEMIELVGLSGKERRRPSQLSGGQQQRVALARALVMNPKVLLLDEPLSALDAQIRQNLRVQIRDIQLKMHITAIFVTHDQEEAMSISDRVFVMHDGVIAQSGSPQDIYQHPRSEFVARFIGHYNVLTPDEARKAGIAAPDCKVVAIRPEAIGQQPGEGRHALSGKVTGVSMLGSVMRYQLDVKGVPMSAEFVNHELARLNMGDEVTLYVADKDVVSVKE